MIELHHAVSSAGIHKQAINFLFKNFA